MDLSDDYCHYRSTEVLYQHRVAGIRYTEGVKAVASDYRCYWLLDLIAISQSRKVVAANNFQIWILDREDDLKINVTCSEGDGSNLFSRQIANGSFGHDLLTLYCENGIIMLPSEH